MRPLSIRRREILQPQHSAGSRSVKIQAEGKELPGRHRFRTA